MALTIAILFCTQPAHAQLAGSYQRTFGGFTLDVPINVDVTTMDDATQLLKERRRSAKRTINREKDQIIETFESFFAGAHRYSRYLTHIDKGRTPSRRSASVHPVLPTHHGYRATIHLKESTPPVVERLVALQFAAFTAEHHDRPVGVPPRCSTRTEPWRGGRRVSHRVSWSFFNPFEVDHREDWTQPDCFWTDLLVGARASEFETLTAAPIGKYLQPPGCHTYEQMDPLLCQGIAMRILRSHLTAGPYGKDLLAAVATTHPLTAQRTLLIMIGLLDDPNWCKQSSSLVAFAREHRALLESVKPPRKITGLVDQISALPTNCKSKPPH
ncbi:hypothetical protein ACFL6C_01180 [Myxococcota bacterium]